MERISPLYESSVENHAILVLGRPADRPLIDKPNIKRLRSMIIPVRRTSGDLPVTPTIRARSPRKALAAGQILDEFE
jgi:hypothetical protein